MEPGEVYFTGGGTESNNLAILGAVRANRDNGRHLIASAIEHSAVLNCFKFLEREGFEVTWLPVDPLGVVDAQALEIAIRPDTILVSVMLANNETGTLQPIADMARITRQRGVLLHTDAVQAFGKIPMDVDELGVDMLSVSAHKLYGPKGVGALYARRGTPIEPVIHGGHHERQVRPGTESIAAIAGFAKAAELAAEELKQTCAEMMALRKRLESGILKHIPGAQLNGHPGRRLPNIVNVSFEGVDSEAMLIALDMRGIAVSTGSACTSGSVEPSHVLHAMGVHPAPAMGSLRLSLGRDNSAEDVDAVVEALTGIVQRLREMSPLSPEDVKA